MMESKPLAGINVVEIGERIAAGACGTVLAALGARVTMIEPAAANGNKWIDRAIVSHGKTLVRVDGGLSALLASADVVIASSDIEVIPKYTRPTHQIVCDITAFGGSGPLAGVAHADAFIQALTGLADTTGEPDAPPVFTGFPVAEGVAGLYAAAGVVAALIARARGTKGQDVEIALYDCAFSTLTTFLPFHFIGKPVTRSGNKHVLAAPWNAYKAQDGWLLVCTGTNDQWRKLCTVMARADLAADAGLNTVPERVARRDEVDGAVAQWVAGRSAAECAQALAAQGIAAGPIVAAHDLPTQENIMHRRMLRDAVLPSAVKFMPRGDQHKSSAVTTDHAAMPLAGRSVLEIGQFTTAPFVARQLGALGAEVLKIESPEGDASRAWPPQQDGQGYFFTLSNADKRSLRLDLRDGKDRATFDALLAKADVLVENLKPGSLARLGLSSSDLRKSNPGLVYCAISGYGADSAYPGRPAFDTVVQAMCGIMDLIRSNGVPQKAGISLADILGGLFALTGTLSALYARDTGSGAEHIDIAMQDAGAWVTQWAWRAPFPRENYVTLQCSDGYIVAAAATSSVKTQNLTRAGAVALLQVQGIASVPVQSVKEAAEHAQTTARALITQATDSAGRAWPLLRCPIRLSTTSPQVRKAIGPLGEANSSLG